MIDLSGQRGVPVITVDDDVIVGYDSERLNESVRDTSGSETYDVIIVGRPGRVHRRCVLRT